MPSDETLDALLCRVRACTLCAAGLPLGPRPVLQAGTGARDYPVVQNGILLIACLVILVNFVVDILYGFANPRIRHQR